MACPEYDLETPAPVLSLAARKQRPRSSPQTAWPRPRTGVRRGRDGRLFRGSSELPEHQNRAEQQQPDIQHDIEDQIGLIVVETRATRQSASGLGYQRMVTTIADTIRMHATTSRTASRFVRDSERGIGRAQARTIRKVDRAVMRLDDSSEGARPGGRDNGRDRPYPVERDVPAQ
jgi:hypothetical protein